ncbi:helix-turn-helix domain-containing protein, partial [Erwinia amylovora]|uniref:helix-turn-helix domain-containing protein n=1 Tax=Erwinia amylovora TaxID=552 RepID=UPI0020C153BD
LADYAARFVLSRSTGYQLKIDDADRLQQLIQQSPRHLRVPRNSAERINYLLTRFLTSAFSLKLEDLADEWFVSRSSLQNDMAGVRERLGRYHLVIETK